MQPNHHEQRRENPEDADDLIRARRVIRLRAHVHRDAKRRSRAHILPDKRLVDNHHQRRIVRVAIGNLSPLNQRNAQGRKANSSARRKHLS
jgi:hypothetical protein